MVEYLGSQAIQNSLPHFGHEDKLYIVGAEMDQGYNEEGEAHQVKSSQVFFFDGPA